MIAGLLSSLLSMAASFRQVDHLTTVVIIHNDSDDNDLDMQRQFTLNSVSTFYVASLNHETTYRQEFANLALDMGLSGMILVTTTAGDDVTEEPPFAASALFEKTHWLLPVESMRYLNQTALRLNNRVIFYGFQEENVMVLEEFYAIRGAKNLSRNELGVWTDQPSQPQSFRHLSHIWTRRNDLQGTTVISSTLQASPVYMREVDRATGKVEYQGSFHAIISLLAKELNFTVRYVEPEDGKWGGKDPSTGEWMGIIGMLVKGEADLSSSGLTITQERQAIIDFSISLMPDPLIFITLDNEDHSINFWAYVDVVTLNAFVMFMITCIVMVACLFILGVSFPPSGLHLETDSEDFGLLQAVAIVGLAFLRLDYQIDRSHPATKIAWLSIAAFTVVALAYYDANLTSRMTVASPALVIRSFQDTLDHHYTVVTTKATVFEELLQKAAEGTPAHQVYQSMTKNPSTLTQSGESSYEYLQRHPKSTFFGTSLSVFGKPHVSSPESYMITHLALGFQKDSELREMFNYHITRLRVAGLLEQLHDRWVLQGEPEKTERTTPGQESLITAFTLGYENLLFPFSVFCCGLVISLGLSIVEKCLGVKNHCFKIHLKVEEVETIPRDIK